MPDPTDRGKEGPRDIGYACEIAALCCESQHKDKSYDPKNVLHASRT
jgi:hypothetical protein